MCLLPTLCVAAPTRLVGVLSEQGDRRCVPAGDEWVNTRLEVGFVELVGELPGAKALMGRPVVVSGTPVAAPARAPVEHTASCMTAQMRSDWVQGPGGMRARRTAPAPISALRVSAVKPLVALSAELEGEEVVVGLRNTLGVPLTELAIEAHYEGCYGKPNALTKRRRSAGLKPNSTAVARVPRLVVGRRARGRNHALRAVSVVAKGEGLVFDLTVDALDLGVAVECPKRR